MHELAEKFDHVEAFAQETRQLHDEHRKLSHRLAASLLVVALMVALLGWVTYRANSAHDKGTRAAEYDLANCEVTNAQRVTNKQVWDELEVLLGVLLPNPRPDLKQHIASLNTKVDQTFALRDCSVVDEGRAQVKPATTR